MEARRLRGKPAEARALDTADGPDGHCAPDMAHGPDGHPAPGGHSDLGAMGFSFSFRKHWAWGRQEDTHRKTARGSEGPRSPVLCAHGLPKSS